MRKYSISDDPSDPDWVSNEEMLEFLFDILIEELKLENKLTIEDVKIKIKDKKDEKPRGVFRE